MTTPDSTLTEAILGRGSPQATRRRTVKTIDLDRFRSEGSRVFSGRERAEAIRKELDLDQLDLSEETVEILVPADTYSVTSSFFLGLFGDSVRRLGEEAFRARYLFRGEEVDPMVDDGIRYALRMSIPL